MRGATISGKKNTWTAEFRLHWPEVQRVCCGMLFQFLVLQVCCCSAVWGDEQVAELPKIPQLPTIPNVATRIEYEMQLQGTLIVPSDGGASRFPLVGSTTLQFDQRVTGRGLTLPDPVRASRKFATASSSTTIGKNHRIQSSLPQQTSLIHVYGGNGSLLQISPEVRLTRAQTDLLQFPCDPLTVGGLLPAETEHSIGARWQAEPGLLPVLTGLDFASTEVVECVLKSRQEDLLLIEFLCTGEGGITGSASTVKLKGNLLWNPEQQLVTSLEAQMEEERSPGVISPGLKVTVSIRWSASLVAPDSVELPPEPAFPTSSQQLLTLQTPWNLAMLASRDWHVYRKESGLMILRRLKHGALLGQCNISPVQSTTAEEQSDRSRFDADVSRQLQELGGQVEGREPIRTPGGWRIYRIRATAPVRSSVDSKPAADGQRVELERVISNYCLCTAKSGQQYSLTFSHLGSRDEEFSGDVLQLLQSLTLRD